MTIRRSLTRAIALVGVATVAVGCGRGAGVVAPPPPSPFGTLTGVWTGVAWSGLAYAVLLHDTLHVVGHRVDPQYYYDEHVQTRVSYRGVGEYPVGSSVTSLLKVVGGDGIVGSAGAEGVVQITSVVDGGNRLEGTMRLTATTGARGWTFTDGSFSVPVYRSWAAVPRLPGRP
ncbi:MAG: hypothetical protein NVS1B4_07300 [Gemmatimonadaceae bacterium]